jgi:hypothetical protein
MTLTKILALLATVVLSLIAVPASAVPREYDNNCCNDGAAGDCGMGQAGAKAYAEALANYYQSRDEWPSSDTIRIIGEQHGCSSGCSCSISELRLWNFEYDHLSLTEPYVQFKTVIRWSNCGIAA